MYRGKKVNQPLGEENACEEVNASYQPRSAMIGVTGSTCECSLADYEEGDETEQREITSIISSPFCQPLENPRPVLSSLPIQQNYPASQTMTVHFFHGCQVTINYGAGVGVL